MRVGGLRAGLVLLVGLPAHMIFGTFIASGIRRVEVLGNVPDAAP